ncbi:Restriction endonuclease S subunits [Archaeoglobus sulfaticallidus PM70-1]|uniref:Restriction endonuclease S subunits n=1 Tax=Archaeoglobus sulfaticallidus PM70-1 TaxID=387631 RepID=N0BDU0_9EURY|nr:restriction endonuclease subunit S [Archaeoglobus sulfaticallidus]AGK61173.1 Restriction endonuclease S subunits [Archaeoglobus sulfaticallidus PM70-1]
MSKNHSNQQVGEDRRDPYLMAEYKETPIGRIPEDWEVVRLGDLGTLTDGDWILKEDYTNEGVRLIQIGNVGVGTFLNKSRRFISPERAKQLNCTFVDPEKDILISRMPDPIGRACLAPRLPYPYIVAVDITILKVDNSKADRNFIVYALNFEATLERVERLASGATRKRISRRNLEKVLIPLPPLPEQRKIAEILSTVDKAIEKIDEAIAKTERLKKGLMQELLTKGIGHEEFKDTEIGRIPKEWEVVRLGDLAETITKGTTPTTYGFNFTESGVNFIKVESIDEHGNFVWDNIAHISEEANKVLSRSILKEGDIVFSIAGALGRVAVVTKEVLPANTNQALAIIRLKKNVELAINYLKYYLAGPFIQKYIRTIAVQSAQANLSLTQVKNFLITLPPLSEQQKITEILSTVDKKLELERKRKEKLERIKKGLMNDLLTGKRRVKPV